MLLWWASVGSRLTSVQRIRTLAKNFPEDVRHSLGRYASLAAAAGDRRWKRLAAEEVPGPRGRALKGPDVLNLAEASTLMLRLRAAFGVGSKADALAFLLGMGGSWVSVSVISEATGYSGTAIRAAARDMVLGRLIRETENRPARYFVPVKPWADLLESRPYAPPPPPDRALPPGRCLFGASVHPYRENAVGCVEEVKGAGACLLKWIPLHQNIDIADPRTVAVLRRCAELGLPLLLHYSGEFTLATQHPEFQDVSALLQVLRRLRDAGTIPTVIVPHAATPALSAFGSRHDHELLVDAMLGDFADEPLYADISALTTIGKIRYLRQMARRQELHHKLLFGSDFPVPVSMCRLRGDLGDEFKRIASIESWPLRALAIFRHLGFNEIVFNRAATLLPNVHRFEPDELVAH